MISDTALQLRLLTGTPDESASLQRVLEGAPRYFEITTGVLPGPAEAVSTLTALPDGRSYDDKRVFGLYDVDEMIGCADVIRGYPVAGKAVIGLMLLTEARQRNGLGPRFLALLEREIARWPEIRTLRIGVLPANVTAMRFWRKLGFVETGEVKRAGPQFTSDVVLLERPLVR